MLDRAAEAKIGERDRVPSRFERRGDVFHAERLDAEERPEAEAFVPRHRPQQQDVHGSVVKRNIGPKARVIEQPCSVV